MNDFIKYNKNYLNASSSIAKTAFEYMNNVVNNASSALASIPTDFSAKDSANSAINNLKDACMSVDSLNVSYTDWMLLMDEFDLDPNQISIFDLGYGPLYVNFDNSIPIAVVPWCDYSADGKKFPIDQYVMGVMDAEEIRGWGSLCYKGEITVEQFFTAAKAFSIVARSYGLYQTVHSSRHHDDLKISDTGRDKQAFKERLFDYEKTDYEKGWPLYTTVTVAAALETTGMVIGNSEKPFNTRYTSSKNAKILEYAIEGKDYISILKLQYPEFFEGDGGLKYYDYKTRKVVGNVPDDTEISELIGVNLSKDKASVTPTKWTYQLTSDGRIVTVAADNFNDGTPFTSQINFTDSTLDQKTNVFVTPTPSPTASPSPTPNPTATPSPTATPKTTVPPIVTPGPIQPPVTTPKPKPSPVGGPTTSPTPSPTATPSSTATPKIEVKSSLDDYNELREEMFELKKIKKTEQPVKEEPVLEDLGADLPVTEEPKQPDPKPPVVEEPKQPDPKPPVVEEPKPPVVEEPKPPVVTEPTYVLPENKFSEIIPNLTGGNLDSMEISISHVNYELSGITDEIYNKYITTIQEAGYTLGTDGNWINGNYILNLVRNNTDLNIYFKLN
jgi:hypothetical protein